MNKFSSIFLLVYIVKLCAYTNNISQTPTQILINQFSNEGIAGDTIPLMKIDIAPQSADSIPIGFKMSSIYNNNFKSLILSGKTIITIENDSDFKYINYKSGDSIKLLTYCNTSTDSLCRILFKIDNTVDTVVMKILPSAVSEIKMCYDDLTLCGDTLTIKNSDRITICSAAYDKYGNCTGFVSSNWKMNSNYYEHTGRIFIDRDSNNTNGYLYMFSIADSTIKDSLYLNFQNSSVISKMNITKRIELKNKVNYSQDLLGRKVMRGSDQLLIVNGKNKRKAVRLLDCKTVR